VPTVIISKDAVKDPQLLVESLAVNSVSRIVLVPSLLRVLLDSCGDLQMRLPMLRLWVTSGEEIPAELAKRFFQAMPKARLINLYGSSEVSADVTCYEIRGDLQAQRVPIGQPIDNTQVYLLDGHLQPVPVGVPGELYVGGAGLARGYLHRPDLTAERFIPSPFRQGEVLFKTGDLGRYLADGRIEYLGRRDHQVKIRGFRVELGEVETRIKEVPAVAGCVVVLREDRPGDQRLVAYYVVTSGGEFLMSDLRSYLLSKLPDFMVPQYFVQLAAIPLTPNGKVDRKALPKPEAGTFSDRGYAAPRTDIERTIADVWRQVLNIEKVGIHDNFFDLGGHSLLMTQIKSKVENLLGRQISMITLFQFPSIDALCTYLCNDEKLKSTVKQIHERTNQQKKYMIWQKHIRKIRMGENQ
jgi:acyl-CoA synthetase (AMP-forming)/AMP-acid ligase II/acyl carrier protein